MPGQKHHELLGHYSGFATRFVALLIDAVIISVSISALALTVSGLRSLVELLLQLEFANQLGVASIIARNVANPTPIIATALSALLFVAYHIFFLATAGRTPGKAFIGVRVVTTSGDRLSWLRSATRFVGYLISALPLFAGFGWVLIDDYRQAWHDKLAGTFVVYTWAARPDEQFLASEIKRLSIKSQEQQ
jgi:uncharacterized RDD family membrane protein YckC